MRGGTIMGKEFFQKNVLRVAHLLFLLLLLVQLLPNKIAADPKTSYVLWLAIGVEVLVVMITAFMKPTQGLNLFFDIIGFLLV